MTNNRLAFSMDNEDKCRIESLQKDFAFSSKTDVVKFTLSLTEYLADLQKNGAVILSKNKAGEEQSLEGLFGLSFQRKYIFDNNGPNDP